MSNLYVDKIFSEHPTIVWPMDDEAHYVSYVSETIRQFNPDFWEFENGLSTVETTGQYIGPFINSKTSFFSTDTSGTNYDLASFVATSTASFDFSDFSSINNTFSIGCYIRAIDPAYSRDEIFNSSIQSYQIGYRYFDEMLLAEKEVLKTFNSNSSNFWLFLSENFEKPQASGSFSIVIKVNYYKFSQNLMIALNGLTMGQGCEEFLATSLGAEVTPIPGLDPSFPGLPALNYGASLDPFGLGGQPGYLLYLDKLMASNTGMPLVFGKKNSIVVNKNDYAPAAIFPGYGFLNNSHRYSTYTVEFWLKQNKPVYGKRKVFGPLFSEDGIYLDGDLIFLSVGSSSSSHVLEYPDSPMLIDWIVSENSSKLMINGQQVISIETDSANMILPSGSNKDWIAFFSNNESYYLVDSLAVYSYAVSSILAKRRFVYGQSVDMPENSNSYFGGNSVVFDGSSSKPANSYAYPNRGKWNQGIYQNIDVSTNSISSPSYSLPDIVFQDFASPGVTGTKEAWYDLIFANQTNDGLSNYFDYQQYVKYVWFNRLDIIQDDVKALYAIFKINQYSLSEEVLLKLENSITKATFSVSIYGDRIFYKFFNGLFEEEVYTDYIYDGRTLFLGIDFDNISENFSDNVRSFFANKSQLAVYLGGYREYSQNQSQFSGGIYRFGLCNEFNFNYIKDIFPSISSPQYSEEFLDAGDSYFGNDQLTWGAVADGGVVYSFNNDVVESMLGHIASYTLFPKFYPGSMALDIATSSYWEDAIPLSYFAKTRKDIFGQDEYSFDFLQFNSSSISMYPDTQEPYQVDTNSVKYYVTFQDTLFEVRNIYSYYQNSIAVNDDRLVVPGDEWTNTKYEVVNGSIVYPPSGISINDLIIVTHIEIETGGILSNPMSISYLKYSSQALSQDSYNQIPTKFGAAAYPFVKLGAYYNYAANNPIRVSPEISSYLFLNSNSGVEIVNDDRTTSVRGISMPINKSLSNIFQVGTVQIFMNFDQNVFPDYPVQIFEIESKNAYWKVYVERSTYSDQRGRIYAINTVSGAINRGLGFYINGRLSLQPTITVGHWNAIGIDFYNILDFSSYSGSWRITGPVKFNYATYYNYVSRDNSYDQESNLPHIKSGILIIDDRRKTEVSAQKIFGVYTGTSRIGTEINPNALGIGSEQYSIYNNVSWKSFVAKPL